MARAMGNLKSKIAAFGFVCFVSFALLPVSVTVCGPATSRLLHHAKKVHQVSRDPSPQIRSAQPDRTVLQRDMIPEESDPVRDPLQHAWAARSPAAPQPQSAEAHLAHGFICDPKVSTLIFQSVLNL